MADLVLPLERQSLHHSPGSSGGYFHSPMEGVQEIKAGLLDGRQELQVRPFFMEEGHVLEVNQEAAPILSL